MNIYGKEYSHEDLLRRSNTSALYGARRVELCDGRGRGERLIEVKTSAGLRLSVLEGKCLDIYDFEYKGVNLAFFTKNGINGAALTSLETDSFTKYWAGGFLATCGLRNTGPSCTVNGEFHPLHGRIGQTPAENVGITVNESEIIIRGKMRETALFGRCLEMERKITIPSDGAKVTVNDTITNLTPEHEKILLLYHINFGFPFLSEELNLSFPKGEVLGRTPLAQENIHSHSQITPPIDGAEEQAFFHLARKKDAEVCLTNKRLGIEARIGYDSSRLPILVQWKCMRSGDYALGIEPGTSFIRGREQELADVYEVVVPAFGSLEFGFVVDIIDIGDLR